MKNIKEQKGITLVALIITIVVLLILATVAINAITEYNIIDNANSAAEKYSNQAAVEDNTLKYYSSIIDKYMANSNGGTENESNKEYINITLKRTSTEVVTQGAIATYTMSVETNGTIKTTNVQAKVLNSSNVEVGNATISGSGTSYTITIDTSELSVGTYKIKVPGRMITTNLGTTSNEVISNESFTVSISQADEHSGGTNN